MCVFISCVSEYTLESTTASENIRDVYEARDRAPGYMGKTPHVGVGYPLESAS